MGTAVLEPPAAKPSNDSAQHEVRTQSEPSEVAGQAGANPHIKRWTFDEYLKLGPDFIDGHSELIDGEILIMPPMGLPHVTSRIALTEAVGPHWKQPRVMFIQETIRLNDEWAPEPDISLFEQMPTSHEKSYGAPRLVIEVMLSSTRRDLTVKKLRYAQNGVPEYWVADLPRRVLHVFRDPILDAAEPELAWRDESILKPDDIATPLCLPELKIKVGDVIPQSQE